MYKIMGLDIGTKRIGVALSDYLLVTANGHSCVMRDKDAVEEITQIARENNVEKIVVGLPLNMDGSFGAQAQDCKNFASQLEYDIIYEDERLTSEEAEERLRERKMDFRKDKSLVDIESACVILEQHLRRIQ